MSVAQYSRSSLLATLIACVLLTALLQTGRVHSSGGNAISKNLAHARSGTDADNNWGLSTSLAHELVRYPSAEVAFICGPQLKAASSFNPFPWFDTVATERGRHFGEKAPRVAPFGPMTVNSQTKQWQNVITGRVSVTRGTTLVAGRGTRFTRDVDGAGPPPYNGHFRIRDTSGVERPLKVRSVESDTHLTLSEPWPFPSVNDTVADTFYDDHGTYGANTDHYYLANYYDTALVQYLNYHRTGDKRFLEYARKTADAWWHSWLIADGTVNQLPPRSMAFAGLMLRALDGRPEMWDYLDRAVRATFDDWVYRRRNDHKLYYDIREDGFAQLYAVMMARVLPDNYQLYANGTLKPSTGTAMDGPAKRETYLSQTEDAAVNFFGRLQRPDGSWRWDADGSSNPDEQHHDIEQPFMVGLYLESVVLLHQLTMNARVKANLINQLTRATRHLYDDAFEGNHPVTDLPPHRWRSMVYFWGGGTTANPKKYSPPAPSTTANKDPGQVRAARHLNSTVHHAFGYAYYITGDESFKQMGDDVFDASYGDVVDGLRSLADSHKAKDYDMNYRASGRYLVWRLAGGKREALIVAQRRAIKATSTSMQPKRVLHVSVAATPALHIAGALLVAKRLSTDLSERDQIESLINQIETALRTIKAERNRFVAAEGVLSELEAALGHARTALSMTESASGGADSAKLRLGWAAARLKRASDRLQQK